MMRVFRVMRNIFFAFNLLFCLFLLVAVVKFPFVLGLLLSEGLGVTIHIAVMAGIFLSAFMVAVFHQLYEQEKLENGRGRW